jgi:hypothetical protein
MSIVPVKVPQYTGIFLWAAHSHEVFFRCDVLLCDETSADTSMSPVYVLPSSHQKSARGWGGTALYFCFSFSRPMFESRTGKSLFSECISYCRQCQTSEYCLPPAFTKVSCSVHYGQIFLRNFRWISTDHTALCPTVLRTSRPTFFSLVYCGFHSTSCNVHFTQKLHVLGVFRAHESF